MSRSPVSPNGLLTSLSPADFELLGPHLEPVEFKNEAVLYTAGDRIDRVYFPHSGIISLVVELAGGQAIEAAMVGRDSVVGAISAMDGAVSLNKAIIQLPGNGEALDTGQFREAARQSETLRAILLRHEQVVFAQAQQSAACNVSHRVEARLSRWLLRARDLSGSDTLALTQEFLAQMLGVGRSYVSPVANALQERGFIRYTRGRIVIVDLKGLQREACECYQTVKAHSDRLLNHSTSK
jgi:CRP-like cAMP-binding protein